MKKSFSLSMLAFLVAILTVSSSVHAGPPEGNFYSPQKATMVLYGPPEGN